ncbi:UNVERIFIED_CONTAM: hypothetical protein HDU68_009300 [Siphonaria sp. JEL0065]|nr:hypothetical protein HDU68_009300 [Siphonaria sp. JEL0065]
MLEVLRGAVAILAVTATAQRITSVNGPLFVDELGRSRIFRGTNVVAKGFPYIPDTSITADPTVSFNQNDINTLVSIGVTAIRLGVMWPGVEPTRGNYNQTYLDQVAKIVSMCSDNGIYVLLDFHQDVFSEPLCGEGVPSWAVKFDAGATAFPAPLGPPFIVDASGFPSSADCAKYNWALYQGSSTTAKNYQRLYSNDDGLRDSFTNYWKLVAKTVLPYKNILGYDLMNEPWNGDQFSNVLLYNPTIANSQNLEPFYEVVSAGIRSVDPNAIIHFESVTMIQDEVGFTKVPGGPTFANTSVFNFHYYSEIQTKFDINHIPSKIKSVTDFGKQQTTLGLRLNTAKEFNCGSFLGEFEMGWGNGKNVPSILVTLRSADSHLVSTTGWELKSFALDTTGQNDGPFANVSARTLHQDMALLYSRPHAFAVAGTPISMEYSDDAHIFVLTFTYNGKTGQGGITEIVTSFSRHFPSGVQVQILSTSGGFTSSSAVDPKTGRNVVSIVPDPKNLPAAGAGVAVALFETGAVAPSFLTAPPVACAQRITSVNGPLFIDELGRSRIFRGTNVVSKAFPYIPDTSVNADPSVSFNQNDINTLASIGVTAIRLGVMWPGVEPTRGNYNQTYLGEVSKIVSMCADSGIYVLLDFHQDDFSESFCGEGVPPFAVHLTASPFNFPFPLDFPYSVDSKGIPSAADCQKHSWPLYQGSQSASESYQRLYTNQDGIRDAFVDYWKLVAKTLLPYKNILGYDLMNEPWVGNAFFDPLLADLQYANIHNLQPFYDAVGAGIRSVDPNAIIHFESVTPIQKDTGFTKVPGGSAFANTSVLNFHYYSDVQKTYDIDTTLGFRVDSSKALACGSFMGEFEMGWGPNGSNVPSILATLRAADKHLVSTTGWELKTFGSVSTGQNDGPFATDHSLRPDMASLYTRPHANAIAGTPISMEYLDDAHIFTLKFTFNGKTGQAGTTEIVTNFVLHFPKGVQVKVVSSSGAFLSSTSTTNPVISKNAIIIVPDSSNLPAIGASVTITVFNGNDSSTLPSQTVVPTKSSSNAIALSLLVLTSLVLVYC